MVLSRISGRGIAAALFVLGVSSLGCSSDPAAPPLDAAVATDTPAATDMPAVTDAPPAMPGEMILAMSGCRNCHQSMNAADGVLSGQTDPRPMTMAYGSNLTPDTMTGIGGQTEAQLVAAIREGVGRGGRTLCGTMPRYRMMTPENAALVARYLLSLTPVNRAIPASMCAPADGGAADASADR